MPTLQCIASHAKPPRELVLDVDASHLPLHGEQERGHFNAAEDISCDLPLSVFAGQDMLACVLRPSDRDPTSAVSALIKRLLVPLRRAWPKTKIIVRADAGCRRPRVLQRLQRWGVHCSTGRQKNARLQQQMDLAELALAEPYAAKQSRRCMFGEFTCAAKTWDKERRSCARVKAESRIKDAQRDLFGRRASCHRFQANPLRLLLAGLAGLADTRMIKLRRLGLQGTEPAKACTATIRTRLLKIGQRFCATPAACGCCWPQPIR